ncbi:MAG TPA: CofH family radical SAM protein [Chitinophagales bacterium]|nr:CofH family radical SAM protein [Chitinophagales bacterium]
MLSPAQTGVVSPTLLPIVDKVQTGVRITTGEALSLYHEAPLSLLAALANGVRERLHGHKTFFNRNFHIEPTNKCVFDCKFCAYSRNFQSHDDAWELSHDQMIDIVRKYQNEPVTEVHIVGGVHPKMNLMYFAGLVKEIREMRPDIHIKGFTAVELEYMFRKARVSVEEGMRILHEHGLQSIPGGGAEIFDDGIRNQICKDKASADEWLFIHETAHKLGMHSNCTMLYGHIETYAHRVDHMNRLRELQDKTNGFNCFIPLKFRNGDNEMSHVPEVPIQEDMRAYAMARIFMDNIPHLKAYWPMIGRNNAQLLLSFGVDDLDGTIDDTTKIYAMAGAEEQNPSLTTKDLVRLIREVNRVPVERDSLYRELKDYTGVVFEDDAKPAMYN